MHKTMLQIVSNIIRLNDFWRVTHLVYRKSFVISVQYSVSNKWKEGGKCDHDNCLSSELLAAGLNFVHVSHTTLWVRHWPTIVTMLLHRHLVTFQYILINRLVGDVKSQSINLFLLAILLRLGIRLSTLSLVKT